MDSDFASKLQNVLSDPEALAKISAIASSLGGNTNSSSESASAPAAAPMSEPKQIEPISLSAKSAVPQIDPRIALLSSLKPLLREEKRGRVDSMLNALTVASMLKTFRK